MTVVKPQWKIKDNNNLDQQFKLTKHSLRIYMRMKEAITFWRGTVSISLCKVHRRTLSQRYFSLPGRQETVKQRSSLITLYKYLPPSILARTMILIRTMKNTSKILLCLRILLHRELPAPPKDKDGRSLLSAASSTKRGRSFLLANCVRIMMRMPASLSNHMSPSALPIWANVHAVET